MFKRRTRGLLLALLVGMPVIAAIPGNSMILAILGISFLIFIHEWGHFYACRLTGTRTETFSIGFGPRLFGWEKSRDGERRFTVGRRQLDPAEHAMDFRVAVIPLGGYVKMAGEIPGEGGAANGGEPAPDEFPAKSAWARSFIISAGVIMNFITAIVFYTVAIYGEKSFIPPVVGEVRPGGAAWHAGLQPGDRIRAVDGNATPTWIDLQMEIAFASRDEAAPVVIERDGKTLPPIPVLPHYNEERGILAFGVGGVRGLDFGEGDDAFSIGAFDRATVAGMPVVGGLQALKAIDVAFNAGLSEIRFAKPDGSSFVYAYKQPADAVEPPAETPGAKIGVEPYGRPVVKAVRGKAKQVFLVGDELVSARSAGEVLALESRGDLQSLRFRPSVEEIVLRREEKESTRAVHLANQAEIAAFLDQMAVEIELDNRVKPVAAGHLYRANGLYRYGAAPAVAAGIPAGARITKVGETLTPKWGDIVTAFQGIETGKPITLTIQVDEAAPETREITPIDLEYLGPAPWTPVELREHWHAEGFGSAVAMGFGRTVRETKNVFRTIGSLFAGTINFDKNIAGPITLVTVSKRFAERGMLRLLWFLAYVSVMLAVLNILPIPILDGGHLMFILIEKIKGAPLKDETIFRFQKIGMILLLVLMFFAFKNDIQRLL